MTTEKETGKARASGKWTDPVGLTITSGGVTYYPPYQLGWQIIVGQRRNIAMGKFLNDDNEKAFKKEMRDIDRYAKRMQEKYGIGLPPEGEEYG